MKMYDIVRYDSAPKYKALTFFGRYVVMFLHYNQYAISIYRSRVK